MQKTTILTFLLLLLISCGGNSNNTEEQSPTKIETSNEKNSTTEETTNLSSREENNAEKENITEEKPLIKGFLIDAPIQGVHYSCGLEENRTLKEGITTVNGEFFCIAPPVTFTIGNYTLGTLKNFTEDKNVYPQDLLELERTNFSSQPLIELIQVLQSLDDDGNISENITISKETHKNLSIDIAGLSSTELVGLDNKELINREEATQHLQNNMPTFSREENLNNNEEHNQNIEIQVDVQIDIQDDTFNTNHNLENTQEERRDTPPLPTFTPSPTPIATTPPTPTPTPVNEDLTSVNLSDCTSCHGVAFDTPALGESKLLNSMSQSEISSALIGYRDGEYGGNLRGVMRGIVQRRYKGDTIRPMTNSEIAQYAEKISSL